MKAIFQKNSNKRKEISIFLFDTPDEIYLAIKNFFKLPNPNLYIWRTSTTLLVDGGADLTCLKGHGGWKSSTVGESYIEESIWQTRTIQRGRYFHPAQP
ncbi:hypothetical protein NQ317_011816 [Molorchus minor]|uniref:Peptidase A2 domain-containing protein n=1 Tax=Molorchus minor TaxID=1323400 RepID=A0ABQ9J681_9CUCU|nr:hypothetical protein NQ317_011816 [Molorchus minor]